MWVNGTKVVANMVRNSMAYSSIVLFMRHRKYQGQYRLKLTYRGVYNDVIIVPNESDIDDGYAKMIAKLLKSIGSIDSIPTTMVELNRVMDEKGIVLRTSDYKSQIKMYTLHTVSNMRGA